MSLFNPNIPNPSDFLSDSQLALKNNNGGLNTVFNVDHYTFNDATAKKGFHNTVTTPLIIGAAHPTPLANTPKFYAMQSTANVGVLQYSRACSNGSVVAAPTPVTNFQPNNTSINIGASSTINILDFTGFTSAIAEFFLFSANEGTTASHAIYSNFFWTGSAFQFFIKVQGTSPTQNQVILTSTGNILQVQNTLVAPINNVFWTLKFHRLAP